MGVSHSRIEVDSRGNFKIDYGQKWGQQVSVCEECIYNEITPPVDCSKWTWICVIYHKRDLDTLSENEHKNKSINLIDTSI